MGVSGQNKIGKPLKTGGSRNTPLNG